MPEFDSRGHFGALASEYDTSAFDQSSGLRRLSEREIDIVIDALESPRLQSVLDVGIGTGRMARPLGALGKKVTGVDITPEMLAEARGACPTADIVLAKLGVPLPFNDDSFDAVVCVRVLKYVHDWDMALAEIDRVLRPKGRAVLEIANRWSVARWGYPGLDVRLGSFGELKRLAIGNGFTLAEVWRGSRAPFPVHRAIADERSARRLEKVERVMDGFLGQTALARSFFVVLDAD